LARRSSTSQGKEEKQYCGGVVDLTGDVKMISQSRPPRHLNAIIEHVFALPNPGRLNFQARDLAIDAVKNTDR